MEGRRLVHGFGKFGDADCEEIAARSSAGGMALFRGLRLSFQNQFSVRTQHSKPSSVSHTVASRNEKQVRRNTRRYGPTRRAHLGQDAALAGPGIFSDTPTILADGGDANLATIRKHGRNIS